MGPTAGLDTVSSVFTDFTILAAESWAYVWNVRTVRRVTKNIYPSQSRELCYNVHGKKFMWTETDLGTSEETGVRQ